MMDMSMMIAANIADKVKQSGKKQVELAYALDVSTQTIRNMLSGGRMINAIELQTIAEFLHINTRELVAIPENTSEDNVVMAFMGKVETESARKALKIVDELADLVIFHARVRENTREMMKPWRQKENVYATPNNCLYPRDSEKSRRLGQVVKKLRSRYAGRNIVRDNIFEIMKNYSTNEHMPLELIKIPVDDKEFCACTFIRKGMIFVMINSNLILAKQIFAAAHELYHLYCYFEEENTNLFRHGSILMSSSMDEPSAEQEDMEANAFAGLFLAPPDQLKEHIPTYISVSSYQLERQIPATDILCFMQYGQQINHVKTHRIIKPDIQLSDVLKLMNVFAIPYKAMVLRMYEEKYIDEKKVQEFFDIPEDRILEEIKRSDTTKPWYRVPANRISFGSLKENIDENKKMDALNWNRWLNDKKHINALEKMLRTVGDGV